MKTAIESLTLKLITQDKKGPGIFIPNLHLHSFLDAAYIKEFQLGLLTCHYLLFQ